MTTVDPDRPATRLVVGVNGVVEPGAPRERANARDVVMAYNACDVFVMPARFEHPSVEGFGLVFREANACGKAVIGTRTGGVPDAIEHERTGLLVEPDDLDAFASAVLRLLTDPTLRAQLGRQGQELVEQSGTWRHAAFNASRSLWNGVSRSRPRSYGGGKRRLMSSRLACTLPNTASIAAAACSKGTAGSVEAALTSRLSCRTW